MYVRIPQILEMETGRATRVDRHRLPVGLDKEFLEWPVGTVKNAAKILILRAFLGQTKIFRGFE